MSASPNAQAEVSRPQHSEPRVGLLPKLTQHYTHPTIFNTTRISYDRLIKRILKDCGHAKLADLKKRNLQDLYEDWMAGGKIPIQAHSLATMLRGLINFGASIEDSECERLSVVMHNMNFTMPKRRSERLTADQANEIRAMAHNVGRPSLALAQAFQFELKLGQREVIGEWVRVTRQRRDHPR